MKMWSDMIVSYAKSRGFHSISLSELYNSPICLNAEINRRLSMDSVIQVIDWMSKNSM